MLFGHLFQQFNLSNLMVEVELEAEDSIQYQYNKYNPDFFGWRLELPLTSPAWTLLVAEVAELVHGKCETVNSLNVVNDIIT